MFAEEEMFGQQIVTIDDKGRIFLPKFTKKTTGNKLLLVHDTLYENYSIYKKSNYEKQIKMYYKLAEESSNVDEKKFYWNLARNMYYSVLRDMTVSKEGRVTIGNVFGQISKVCVIGHGDHVILDTTKVK